MIRFKGWSKLDPETIFVLLLIVQRLRQKGICDQITRFETDTYSCEALYSAGELESVSSYENFYESQKEWEGVKLSKKK